MNKPIVISIISLLLGGAAAFAQTAPASAPQSSTPPALAPAPLHLNNIAPPAKLTFPPASPKNFTAQSPTKAEVNSFLKDLWGYDPNRVWEVYAIQTTPAPNVSRVIVLVGEQGVSKQPTSTVFFVTPDGKHIIAGNGVVDFGSHPFAAAQEKLTQRATGPYRGSSSKKLLLVEFADLECPHCKEAAPTMDRLAKDYPNARIVFQNFPLTHVHPAAEQAAEYGVCVAKLKGNAAFFQYAQAVYDTQANLRTDAAGTLNAAVTKAGADPAAVGACAATPATKAAVDASVALGKSVGVNETPLLYINGRPVPAAGVPYATLKQIISYDASTSGSAAGAQ